MEMDSTHNMPSNGPDSRPGQQEQSSHPDRGGRTRALVKAITELVDHGIVPLRQQTEFLGQASIWLEQAQQAAAVLRSSKTAMINNGLGAGNMPWDWFLLYQDEALRAGVIAVNPYRPVPAHDHPGASGILLMLEGHLIEHHYQLDTIDEAVSGKVTLLAGKTRYLDADHYSIYLPDWNNVHSLSAMGRPAIALSIQLNPAHDSKRSWFLPIRDETAGKTLAVRTHQGILSQRST